jgi:hypothetical protein
MITFVILAVIHYHNILSYQYVSCREDILLAIEVVSDSIAIGCLAGIEAN